MMISSYQRLRALSKAILKKLNQSMESVKVVLSCSIVKTTPIGFLVRQIDAEIKIRANMVGTKTIANMFTVRRASMALMKIESINRQFLSLLPSLERSNSSTILLQMFQKTPYFRFIKVSSNSSSHGLLTILSTREELLQFNCFSPTQSSLWI